MPAYSYITKGEFDIAKPDAKILNVLIYCSGKIIVTVNKSYILFLTNLDNKIPIIIPSALPCLNLVIVIQN